jgi:plastocyanin
VNMRALVRSAALGITLLVACSSAREPRTHHVEIRGMEFVPAELTVAVGDTVVWTNADVLPHTVTAAGELDSQSIESKQTWQAVMKRPGELSYVCTYHPTMKATLTVR